MPEQTTAEPIQPSAPVVWSGNPDLSAPVALQPAEEGSKGHDLRAALLRESIRAHRRGNTDRLLGVNRFV